MSESSSLGEKPVHQPLQGIRVLDLSRLLPGAYTTQLLAEMGAEVVKVETPLIGDYARHAPEPFGGGNLFHPVNRGKKSLALNYRNPRGREVFMRVVETADVILENFRPGLATRYRIDYPEVKNVKPAIVYCSLSGYGQTGPFRDRAGHDLNYIAVGGLLAQNGAVDGPPIPPGVQIADMAGGMLAAVAILGALVGRQSAGNGAYLDVSMLDAVVSWVVPLAGPIFTAQDRNPQRGRMPLSGGLPCFNVYRAADGRYLSLAALEPPLWTTFCKAIDREDLLSRQWDFEAIDDVAAVFSTRSCDEWTTHFEGMEVCLEPVSDFIAMMNHPQVQARGLVLDKENEKFGPVAQPFPFRERTYHEPSPSLGEHTRELLTECGFSRQEISDLETRKVIRCVGTTPSNWP